MRDGDSQSSQGQRLAALVREKERQDAAIRDLMDLVGATDADIAAADLPDELVANLEAQVRAASVRKLPARPTRGFVVRA